jgi:aminoglycoside 6-adenylyltransferase
MRSEQEMLDLIVDTAKNDERIRAVVMNGSRANINAPYDVFQDFDIVYLVTDVAPFKKDFEWIKRFGELMILQMPEDMQDPPPSEDDGFTYLMQFKDGNRIDLGIYPLNKLKEITKDSLSAVLLDKDQIIGIIPPANEEIYLPKPPSAKAYADCCNEFWWVSVYVAKGLWRKEILYARYMLDQVDREELMKMLKWYIGIRTGFSKNPGKFGKYFEKYLEPNLWVLLKKTYADASYENTWEAMFTMGNLFRRVAKQVANHFGYTYAQSEDENISAHLRHVHKLPIDAKEMY